jgi:hypothetical protein
MSRLTYEFPDFDYDLPEIDGFADTSWHNDVCPSLTGPHDLILWCDYADPSKREYADSKRFLLVQGVYGESDENQATLCASDDLADILTAIQTVKG